MRSVNFPGTTRASHVVPVASASLIGRGNCSPRRNRSPSRRLRNDLPAKRRSKPSPKNDQEDRNLVDPIDPVIREDYATA